MLVPDQPVSERAVTFKGMTIASGKTASKDTHGLPDHPCKPVRTVE